MAPSKKVCCGSCNIFTLARILTILEFIMSILLFVFIHGAKFYKFGEIKTPKVGIGMEVGGANGFTPPDLDAPPLPPKH